eukprot:GEMP01101083.1.p1 GENE.GEMP01101083.1~~GEMP01101083.1.p1  ORF type:complete len:104 (-),score=3.17 GEMP01101083.1:426-737(-)
MAGRLLYLVSFPSDFVFFSCNKGVRFSPLTSKNENNQVVRIRKSYFLVLSLPNSLKAKGKKNIFFLFWRALSRPRIWYKPQIDRWLERKIEAVKNKRTKTNVF